MSRDIWTVFIITKIFIVDHGNTICHSSGSVTLFEYNGVEYDVGGAPSGDGCISEYFIYYEEESDEDSTTGELMTVDAALQEGYITISEINSATYESGIYETYRESQILADQGTIFFVNGAKQYNQSNPYTLTTSELNSIVSILATTKYQYVEDEENDALKYTTLKDNNNTPHLFQIYDTAVHESIETAIAVLAITDTLGVNHTYLLYETGMQILNEDMNAYAGYMNQTYILELLEDLDQ